MARKRIVIAGGGFAGVYTARALERLLEPGEAELCLVNRDDYFVFQPLLPEVISGSIELLDIVSPIRRLCPRTRVLARDIESIDLAARTVTLAPRIRPRPAVLPYDALVIAAGVITNFSGMPGLADHAFPFRSLGDALRLRNHVLQVLDEASTETSAGYRAGLLTFVVAGGGFSGVEVIAELNDFLRRSAARFGVPPGEIRTILVHAGERILPEVSPGLAAYAHRLLARRGVEIRLKAKVTGATAASVHLDSAETVHARTLVSTVPSGPLPFIQALDCRKDKGRVAVNASLELDGHEGVVWALGDCAAVRMAGGAVAPPTAQHATREAETVAANIAAALRGSAKQTFHFPGLGKLGSLGHRSAVAEVFGKNISGFPAWFLWRTVYLMKMPGLDRKLRVGFDWFTALLFPSDIVQLRVQPSYNLATEHFETGEFVFEQGDAGDRLYFVRSGEVEVVLDGERIATLGPGQYFGEMALLGNLPRKASVRATCPTDLTAIGKPDFHRLMETFPALMVEMSALAGRRAAGPG